MKKVFILFLLVAVCCTFAFAEPKAGASMTFTEDMQEIERFAIEMSDRIAWRFGDEDKKVCFSLLLDSTGGVAFAHYDDLLHVHLDFSLAVLPGMTVRFNEAICMNVFVGPKYSRIGYAGDLDKANGWDKVLSVMTVGLAGSHPLRKVEAALDLSFQFAFLTVGVTAGYPIFQGQDAGYKQGLSLSAYGAVDLNF